MTSAKLCKGKCVGGGGGVRGEGEMGGGGGGQLGAQCNHNTPDQAHDAIKIHHSHYDVKHTASLLPKDLFCNFLFGITGLFSDT